MELEERKRSSTGSEADGDRINVNLQISFPSSGPEEHFVVDNATDWRTQMFDEESGAAVLFMYGLITPKGADGDLKLAKMCAAMRATGMHHHTYDAKSGAPTRITRIGATRDRLEAFADATNYMASFAPGPIREASLAAGLKVENPPGSNWYGPYEFLSGPFEIKQQHLYIPFSDGDLITLFTNLVSGNPHYMDAAKGCGFDVHALATAEKDNEFCLAVFPLHNFSDLDELSSLWLPLDWPSKLPVFQIKEYFGEEVGFYFGFLNHLTTFLVPLSPIAFVAMIISFDSTAAAMHVEAVFALLGMGVYSVLLDSWRFEQNKMAHLWRVFGCSNDLPPRPGFKGMVLPNPVTGKLEVDFPKSLRRPRTRVSSVTNAVMIIMVLAAVVSIFIYKSILVRSGASGALLLVPSLLNAMQISIFGIVYQWIAEWLTSYENHKTMLEHNSELFRKLTFFYFINYYATLFYIAFIKSSVEGCANGMCGTELAVQIAVVFLTNDFGWRITASVILPYLQNAYKKFAALHTKSLNYGKIGEIERQFLLMENYDPTRELVLDYIELYVQWGYLCMFGAAFPAVAMFACLTNYVETRTDGQKLIRDFRRVVPNSVDGIGEPFDLFMITLYVAAPTNAGLIVYTFNAVDFLPKAMHVWVFVLIILGIFMGWHYLDKIYPDVPEKTSIQLERQRVIYERVVLGNEDENRDMQLDLKEDMLGKPVSNIKVMEELHKTQRESLKVTVRSVPVSEVRLPYTVGRAPETPPSTHVSPSNGARF